MTALDLTREEALELWSADIGETTNAEQETLDAHAKSVKVSQGCGKGTPHKSAPRKPKVSAEKQQLFADLVGFLAEKGYNYQILNQNKLISVQITDKKLKIDVIQSTK